MTAKRPRRMTWIAPALALGLVIAHQIAYGSADAAEWTFGIGFVVYAAVGGLIADRYPRNPVGWLFCVIGVVFAAGDFVSDYADRGGNPGATALAVLNTATGPGTLVVLALALMLFPTGRFLSAGWRRAAAFMIAANVVLSLVLTLEPGQLSANTGVENPLGVDAAAGLLHTLADAGALVIVATVLIALAAIVARFRAARGIERQQLKWLALLAVLGVAVLACLLVIAQFANLDTGTGQVAAGVVLGLLSMAPALAAAVAILRYRLYAIDRILNRALVYAVLTAALLGAYLAFVVCSRAGAPDVRLQLGGVRVDVGRRGAVPARAWARAAAVDRRFRRSYDATSTLDAFAERLREHIDLEALARICAVSCVTRWNLRMCRCGCAPCAEPLKRTFAARGRVNRLPDGNESANSANVGRRST